MKLKPYLIATALYFPSLAIGDIGDVYYCQTEVIASIESGTIEQYKPQRFIFSWEEKDRIQFRGEESFFGDSEYELTESYPILESFSTNKDMSVLSFHEGRFRYSYVSQSEPTGRRVISEIVSILAGCEKF